MQTDESHAPVDSADSGGCSEELPASDFRGSSTFWTRAIANSPMLLFVTDIEGTVIAASDSLTQRLGYAETGLVGRHCYEFMHASGDPPAVCPLAALLDDGAQHAVEMHSDALGADLLVTVTPLPGPDGQVAGTLHVAHDVTERKRIERALRASEARHRDIVTHSPVAIFQSVGEQLVYANPAFAEIYGYDSPREILEALRGRAVSEVLYDDPARREPFVREVRSASGAWRGFETLYRRKDGTTFEGSLRFCEREQSDGQRVLDGFVQDVTAQKRAAADLAASAASLRRALESTVEALGATVEMRDPYTASHQRRVAELACAIAAKLGWSEEVVATLRTAAQVHDIGKIAVPAEILAKPARLNEAEYALIRYHPQVAFDILTPVQFEAPVAQIIFQHHERLDGCGYPSGLRGADILAEALVLSVADVVEAMVSHRPYRAALPLATAMAEIREGAGLRYDAAACEACAELFEVDGFVF